MQIVLAQNKQKEVISCDRTIKELSKSKYKIGFVPGIFDLIKERSLPDDAELEEDEYAFKIASLARISPYPSFFIVADSEKEKLRESARQKGYSLSILSSEDYKLA